MEHAVHRAKHNGQRNARRDEIPHRDECHANESQHEDGASSPCINKPTYERSRHDGGHTEQGCCQPDGQRIAPQPGNKEGERGQQRMEIDENKKVYQTDSGKRPRPEFVFFAVLSILVFTQKVPDPVTQLDLRDQTLLVVPFSGREGMGKNAKNGKGKLENFVRFVNPAPRTGELRPPLQFFFG